MIKNNKKTMKTLVFSLGLVALLLTSTNLKAQYDGSRGLFGLGGSSADYEYSTRDGLIGINDNTGGSTNGIQNDSFGTPLGSGIAILLAAGAGYAVVRRKRSRKNTMLLLACVALLGFTQCKKEQTQGSETEVKTVNITLNVGGNGGSRHTINTENGDVTFQNSDVIYVGDGSHYIGTLTRTDGIFSGNINQPADNTEIYFYFVGGLTPSIDPSAGSTSSFTVDISDQSSQMPVLSCNHVTYKSGTSSYSCTLQNKCALVKFTTNTNASVHVGGLYTEALIDFEHNNITNNGTTGFINLKSENQTTKWAVLLPQTSFPGAECVIADKGYTISMPAIEADAFLTGGISFGSTSSHNRYLQWAAAELELKDGDHVYGTLGGRYKVKIENKVDGATVTLHNVNINGSGTWTSGNYAGLNSEGDATIILAGGTTNTVKGFNSSYPGIYVPSGKTLTIQGTGSLNASSNGSAAGIGGCRSISCGNITISSGTVTATGGSTAAGIGSGVLSSCGDITINGGTVTANGGSSGGAGIGCGGYYNTSSSCGDIIISGGTVNASSNGYGAGIGSGSNSSCLAITISGGTVTATGGQNGAGIGCGMYSTCGTITISNGTIEASGGKYGAGIGGGFGSTSRCNAIIINGGEVTATGKNYSAGIGTGYHSACTDGITIENTVTRVTAIKGSNSPNSIGAGDDGTCGTVTIGGVVGAISTSPYTYQP